MTKLAFLFPVLALTLAACGEEPAPQPVPTQASEPAAPSLPAPDQETFTNVLAAACPEVEPVNTAVCRRSFGSTEVTCEYGLGEDTYLRNKATLIPGDGTWNLLDPETVCAAGAQ